MYKTSWIQNERRGRLKGGRSHYDIRLLQYLAFVSVSNDVASDTFFDKIIEAWNHQTSVWRNLLFECREKLQTHVFFLVTKRGNVVTQFRMPNHLLQETNPLREFESTIQSDITS